MIEIALSAAEASVKKLRDETYMLERAYLALRYAEDLLPAEVIDAVHGVLVDQLDEVQTYLCDATSELPKVRSYADTLYEIFRDCTEDGTFPGETAS